MKPLLRIVAALSLASSLGGAAFGQHYKQTNLISNTSGNAEGTDSDLVNPWGLSRTSGSAWWVADNLTGVATLYNGPGAKQSLVVTIPPADPTNKSTPNGSPTGTVSNGSPTDFLMSAGNPAIFIFATVDGTIAAWNPNFALAQGAKPPSTHAVTVVKTGDGSGYTGLTSASVQGKPYLYAANFTKGRVDVYDNAFHLVDLGYPGYDQGKGSSEENKPFEDR